MRISVVGVFGVNVDIWYCVECIEILLHVSRLCTSISSLYRQYSVYIFINACKNSTQTYKTNVTETKYQIMR